ncbi:MAG TPA: outer membrane beta-barrel protein [Methylocella sp.]|nr:outer membrane beta-barrel protein [Methylocella sp.]
MGGCTKLQLGDKIASFIRGRQAGNHLRGMFLGLALGTVAGPVLAADVPSRIESPAFEPPPPPEYDWTGFYAGVHVGGGIDHFAFPYSITVPGFYGYTEGRSGITADGPFGGLQAGYNYALPFFHLVAGFEIDGSVSGIRGQTEVSGALINGSLFGGTFGSKFEDFGTARVRLGCALGRFLPYLTAGFTYATTQTYYNLFTPGVATTGSINETRTGVFPHVGAFGAGLEYAIDPHFSVKAEYLYEFINSRAVLFNPAPATSVQFNTRTMYHVARVGLNYKFDWLSPAAPPIVAKY